MRTEARIFRVASPLDLVRCRLGGGGCWLCGQTQTRPVPPLPSQHGNGPPPSRSPRSATLSRTLAHLAKRENGKTAAGSAAPRGLAGSPVVSLAGHRGGPSSGPCPCRRHNCAQPLRPFSASPGQEVGSGPKPEGSTWPLKLPGSEGPSAPPSGHTPGRWHPGKKPQASCPAHPHVAAHIVRVGAARRKGNAGQPRAAPHGAAFQGVPLVQPPNHSMGPVSATSLPRPCQGHGGLARP